MATKQWDSDYQDLLDIMDVSSLADRRLHLKLSLPYKIVRGMCYFPSDILCPHSNYSNRTKHSLVINQPFALTNAYYFIQFLHGTLLHEEHDTAPFFFAFKYNFHYY